MSSYYVDAIEQALKRAGLTGNVVLVEQIMRDERGCLDGLDARTFDREARAAARALAEFPFELRKAMLDTYDPRGRGNR